MDFAPYPLQYKAVKGPEVHFTYDYDFLLFF